MPKHACCKRSKDEMRDHLAKIIKRQGGIMETPYINLKTNIRIRCDQNHQFELKPRALENLSWCPECGPNTRRSTKNISENLERIVQSQGGTILTPYINMDTSLVIRCREGHEFRIRSRSILNLSWCPQCRKLSSASEESPEPLKSVQPIPENDSQSVQENIQRIVESQGGKVLIPYVSRGISLLLECAEGHQFRMLPQTIEKRSWCSKCKQSKQKIQENIQRIVESQGGTVLIPYVNRGISLLLRCGEGHEFRMRPQTIENRSWCPECKKSAQDFIKSVLNPEFVSQSTAWISDAKYPKFSI